MGEPVGDASVSVLGSVTDTGTCDIHKINQIIVKALITDYKQSIKYQLSLVLTSETLAVDLGELAGGTSVSVFGSVDTAF